MKGNDVTKYKVTGMSCAACSARVQRIVSDINGVKECAVDLISETMFVSGIASEETIISAVAEAGYTASRVYSTSIVQDYYIDGTKGIRYRLSWSIVLLVMLMYISMGHVMLGLPLFNLAELFPIVVGIVELLLTLAIFVINGKFFVNGARGAVHGAPNMDTLVAVGSSTAFIYSALMLPTIISNNNTSDVLNDLYFESAAMIVTLVTFGKLLEARSKGKTSDALKGLLSLKPNTAVLLVDGEERIVPTDNVQLGDLFVCRAGTRIPVDGEIVCGKATTDESALTGESVPIDKILGSKVYSGTITTSGYIVCRAVGVGEETGLAKIIATVTEASASKAPIARMADKVAGIFVPTVMAIAVITVIIWIFVGQNLGYALARGISVLVISCPCSLGLATPVAITVASGIAARKGILFKNATAIEDMGKISIIALDKTGTVTYGKPQVMDVIAFDDVDDQTLLKLAYSIERLSEHPLARAISEYCEKRDVVFEITEDYETLMGSGVHAKINGIDITGGSLEYIKTICVVPDTARIQIMHLAQEGKTPLCFVRNNTIIGVIAVTDTVKSDASNAIRQLNDMGVHLVMLTGDNIATATAVAKKVGITEVIAEIMPYEKKDVVDKLRSIGKVAMVGDGINDAPALVGADVGIAVGAGTDIAIDSADVVLLHNEMNDVVSTVDIGRKTLKIIKENLFWAFIYNILGIPLAAGGFVNLVGFTISPMLAAAAMSLSSVCVVMNALRLNYLCKQSLV